MTVKTNGDMPAMPTHDVYQDCGIDGNSGPYLTQTTSYGLTKREAMAMRMMASLTSVYWGTVQEYETSTDLIKCQSETAVEMADALLAELERTKTATKQQHLEVLAGWQWVPIEATREMIDAAILVEEDGYAAMHSAMLAAAPKLGGVK